MKDFKNIRSVHCLGVGGIGVSAVARFLSHEGKDVSGQDTDTSPVTEALKKEGIPVFIGQSIARIPKGTDLIIYSGALGQREPEFLARAKGLGIPAISYSQALGVISRGKYTIAVSGTHGKTTTTALIAAILRDAGLSPTVIVGSVLKDTRSNFVAGDGRFFVVEADEYRRQFLSLSPMIAVVTNVGLDHLDYYKDLSDIQSAFASFVEKVPATGYVVTRLVRPNVAAIAAAAKARIVDYRGFLPERTKLALPGLHNRENAAAALAVAHLVGVGKRQALSSLERFEGIDRRFDYRGKTATGALVYDDYAHNPDKVRAAIAGFREAHPGKRLIVVFQPHLYSRTKTLLEGFSSAFDGADTVLLTPIFAARERRDTSVTSETLAERIRMHRQQRRADKPDVGFAKDFGAAARMVRRRAGKGDIIVTMGAGDVYQVAERLAVR